MSGRLDIVIVNWNAGALLQACVSSVNAALAGSGLTGQLIVVDNGSEDGSADNLCSAVLPLAVIRNADNRGFGRACNQGAAAGTAEFLLFLNPDAEVTVEAMQEPWRFLSANRSHGVCGIQLRDEHGVISRSCARHPNRFRMFCASLGVAQALPALPLGIAMTDWDHATSRDVDHVIGAFYLIRRRVFESVGGFDERYFMYLEDLDLSGRVRSAGWRIHYLATAQARHIGGGTSRRIRARRLYYAVSSRLIYIRRHFGAATYCVFLPLILLVEPAIRAGAALARFDLPGAGEVWAAYRWLWRNRWRHEAHAGAPLHVAAPDRRRMS